MEFNLDKLPRHDIMTIDFKSYYASVECVLRGLDPLTTYLAVVGDITRRGSVVLAASPLMKKEYKIKTGSRHYEIPLLPHIYIVPARMKTYLDFSMRVPHILKRFGPVECIHVYSVDEVIFTYDSHSLFGDKWTAARAIQNTIHAELGLPVAIGIGQNFFQSKCCLDVLAKHASDSNYIAEVTYETFAEKIWDTPIKECWGVGNRLEKRLHASGIYTIGQLANANLPRMKAKFGVIGEQLVMHARGIDFTDPYHKPILQRNALAQKGFGSGITLMRNHSGAEVIAALLDRVDEVAYRSREVKMAGRTVSLGIGYSDDIGGGGFSQSRTIETPTNLTQKIFNVCKEMFYEKYDGRPVRNIHVGLSNLVDDEIVQLDIFEDDTKDRRIAAAVDDIRRKYGVASVFWARSLTEGGSVLERSEMIGGHRA